MTDLEKARKEISETDKKMAELFEKRMTAVRKVADYKKERGLAVKDNAREQQLIEKCRAYISDPEIESYYVKFLKGEIELSCDFQEQLINGMKVAYCGSEGAYAFLAAKSMFPSSKLLPFESFEEAYYAVSEKSADCVVLPLENSFAGEVGAVTDLLFSGDLYINRIVDMEVAHNLVAKKGTAMADIKTVVSHPQAIEQCAEYIKEHGFETHSYSNTALAAKHIKESDDKTVAAIASKQTAEHFGLQVIEERINTSTLNVTKFAVLSRVQNLAKNDRKREDEHFIIVFTVKNEAGALAQTLNIIGAHGYNMRALRSRPMRDLAWNYYFYIEADGDINTQNGREMLQELSAVCARLKLVGAYYSEKIAKE